MNESVVVAANAFKMPHDGQYYEVPKDSKAFDRATGELQIADTDQVFNIAKECRKLVVNGHCNSIHVTQPVEEIVVTGYRNIFVITAPVSNGIFIHGAVNHVKLDNGVQQPDECIIQVFGKGNTVVCPMMKLEDHGRLNVISMGSHGSPLHTITGKQQRFYLDIQFVRTLKVDCQRTTHSYFACPLCYVNFRKGDYIFILKCEHAFHQNCAWSFVLRIHDDRGCPLCYSVAMEEAKAKEAAQLNPTANNAATKAKRRAKQQCLTLSIEE